MLAWGAALGWCIACDIDHDVIGVVIVPIQGITPVLQLFFSLGHSVIGTICCGVKAKKCQQGTVSRAQNTVSRV